MKRKSFKSTLLMSASALALAGAISIQDVQAEASLENDTMDQVEALEAEEVNAQAEGDAQDGESVQGEQDAPEQENVEPQAATSESSTAITEAREAIAALPDAENITLENAGQVAAARAALEKATDLGAGATDIPGVDRLVNAEARIAALESEGPKESETPEVPEEPEVETFDFDSPYATEEEARNAGYAYLSSDLNTLGHNGFSIDSSEGYFIVPNFNGETPAVPLEPAEPVEPEAPEEEYARAYIGYQFVDEDENVVHESSQFTNEVGVVGETYRFPATGIVLPEGYNLAPNQEFGERLEVTYGNRDDYPTVRVEVIAQEPEVEYARAYIAYEFVDEDGNVVHRNSQFTNEEGVVGETYRFPATGIPVPEGYNLADGQSFGDRLEVAYGNRDDYPTVRVEVIAQEPEVEYARAYIAYEFVDEDGNVVHRNSQYTNEEGVVGETYRFPATGIVLPEGYNLAPDQSFGERLEVTYGNRDDYPTVRVQVVAQEEEVQATYIGGIIEVDENGKAIRTMADFTLEDENAVYYELSDRLGALKEDGYEVANIDRQYDDETGSVTWVAYVREVVEEETPEEAPEETHGLSLVVRDLDGERTTDVRVRVTNSDGERVAGRFNRRGQWRSYEELPEGRYTVQLRTPRGTYAIIIDTITQGTLPTDDRNVFTVDIDEDNLFGRRGVLGAFQLVQTPYAKLLDRLEEIEERLADLEADNEELREEQERLQEELNRLENELAGAEERIAELEDRVDDLESRVDELEAEAGDSDKEDPVEDEKDKDEKDKDKEDSDKDKEDVDKDKKDSEKDKGKKDSVKDKEDPVVEKVAAEVVVNDNDDDTDADVGADTDSETSEEEAEESLPQTGASSSILGLGVASILAGLGFTTFDRKKRK